MNINSTPNLHPVLISDLSDKKHYDFYFSNLIKKMNSHEQTKDNYKSDIKNILPSDWDITFNLYHNELIFDILLNKDNNNKNDFVLNLTFSLQDKELEMESFISSKDYSFKFKKEEDFLNHIKLLNEITDFFQDKKTFIKNILISTSDKNKTLLIERDLGRESFVSLLFDNKEILEIMEETFIPCFKINSLNNETDLINFLNKYNDKNSFSFLNYRIGYNSDFIFKTSLLEFKNKNGKYNYYLDKTTMHYKEVLNIINKKVIFYNNKLLQSINDLNLSNRLPQDIYEKYKSEIKNMQYSNYYYLNFDIKEFKEYFLIFEKNRKKIHNF